MHMRLFAVAAVLVALAAAGCGAGPKSPSVASLGGSATTTSQSDNPLPGGGGGPSTASGRGGPQFEMKINGGLKFAQCMRAHGVHNFPDPDASGGLTVKSGSGIDPSSPTFRTAQQACAKLLPNGGKPTPQQLAKMKKSALAFSACMRAHGLKDFPDPDFSGGGIGIRIGGRGASDLNPNNPTFQRARAACGSLLKKP
jgi:hypothetical protein